MVLPKIYLSSASQQLQLLENGEIKATYAISTGKNGMGELKNSEKTPRGRHIIRAKIGADCPVNAVFVGRRPTGEIYHSDLRQQFPNRDWILTRILWLSGLEVGRNRLGNVDTMQRYIYIHGTPDDVNMGEIGSRGCVRMRNRDIIELFNRVKPYTEVMIE